MKKQKLSEIFSALDLSSNELPEIYSKDDISYKAIQKKVAEKINGSEYSESIEPISSTEKRNIKMKNIKRFLLGVGVAAIVLAGGAGAVAVSNAGKNVKDNSVPQSAIDISNIETELSGQKTTGGLDDIKSTADADGLPPFYECPDVYRFSVIKNEMKGIELQEVKYFRPNSGDADRVFVYFHFVSDGTVDLTKVDRSISGNFGLFTIDPKYFIDLYGPWFFSDESDSTNLYAAINIESNSVDSMRNEYKFDMKAFLRNDFDKITEMGMKNLMGFTNAEINARKDFTSEMKERIVNEYVHLDDYYYKNEDVLAFGDLSVNVDVSEAQEDIEKSYISAVMQSFDNGALCQIEKDTFNDMSADIMGIRRTGNATEVVVRFMADENSELPFGDAELSFDEESAGFYSDKELTKSIESKAMSVQTYTDPNGTLNLGVPCILRYYKFVTPTADNVYFGYSCSGSGKEIQLINEVDSIGLDFTTDANPITDDKAGAINAEFTNFELCLSMNVSGNEEIPEYLDISSGKEKEVAIVTNYGRRYPVRLLLYKEEDGTPVAVGTFMTPIMNLDDIDHIEYKGETIFNF